jgi:hypothetical protein
VDIEGSGISIDFAEAKFGFVVMRKHDIES